MGGGYSVGPTLAANQRPWPITWEQDASGAAIAAGTAAVCPHTWESVLLLADGLHRLRMAEVVRCSYCHVPRCSGPTDPDPCMLAMHHPTGHTSLAGYVWPKGGDRPPYPNVIGAQRRG